MRGTLRKNIKKTTLPPCNRLVTKIKFVEDLMGSLKKLTGHVADFAKVVSAKPFYEKCPTFENRLKLGVEKIN